MCKGNRGAAVESVQSVIMSEQRSLDATYKKALLFSDALGFTEEESVDIVQGAMRNNAEILKDEKPVLSRSEKAALRDAKRWTRILGDGGW